MSDTRDLEHTDAFYTQLFSKAWVTMAVIAGLSIISLWLVPGLKGYTWMSWSILVFAMIKTYFIVRPAFDQLMKIIGQSHLLTHILVLFGLLISLIIISFAIDFTSLYCFNDSNYKSEQYIDGMGLAVFFENLYFSTITFSSVGYGDIVPSSTLSKTLVMLEVTLRFFVLVFGIANINQIRINN